MIVGENDVAGIVNYLPYVLTYTYIKGTPDSDVDSDWSCPTIDSLLIKRIDCVRVQQGISETAVAATANTYAQLYVCTSADVRLLKSLPAR